MTIDGLPALEQQAAHTILGRTGTIALHREGSALRVLVRLPERRLESARLVASADYSIVLYQLHSRVDVRPILVEGVHERQFQGSQEADSVSSDFAIMAIDRSVLVRPRVGG